MSDRAALVAAVAATADDDLPKLVFADWLDENGEPERAEFVRLSVATGREAAIHPPASDPVRQARLRELFGANCATWLRPVYDALGQSLPAFGPPGTTQPNDDRWDLGTPGRVVVSHHHTRPVPILGFHAGLVSLLTLNVGRLLATASLADAMAHEPLEALNLRVPSDVPAWERFCGPHLKRVRALAVTFSPPITDPVLRIAEAVCDPATFGGVREMTVTPEVGDRREHTSAVLYDTLRVSPLRRQLTALSLYDLPAVGQLLARGDHGFDALRELTVSVRGLRGGADGLFVGGISDWFRERLTRLVIDTSRAHGVGWLTGGRAWERLEGLFLSGNGVGDAGATAVARATTLPALRELHLSRVTLTDTGAAALAACPLLNRLETLHVDGNAIGDEGARRLAAALDRGLGCLSVGHCTPPLPAATAVELSARYGPRISLAGARG